MLGMGKSLKNKEFVLWFQNTLKNLNDGRMNLISEQNVKVEFLSLVITTKDGEFYLDAEIPNAHIQIRPCKNYLDITLNKQPEGGKIKFYVFMGHGRVSNERGFVIKTHDGAQISMNFNSD